MATGTNYYNLTKPASNENYNLATWNTNLDMIDAQMYQNETEVFGGATSLADGTVGNVPAPAIADKDKFLKGDGTWATPSGGGGGSSTLAGLTDVNISSPTNGQALVYDATNQEWVNGTVSGGGGSGLTATILSNTLWSSAGTYTLNDDYDNYDILEIYFCNPSVAGQESDLITVMVNDVKALMNDSKILNLTGYGDRYVNCTFSADEFTITASSTGGVQKIVGYKAGGGSSEVKYSTTEHKVGTWIDGSDVYEQTIILRENGTNNYTYIDSVFSQCLPANIDWIDIVSFYSKRNVGGYVDCMNNSSETNIVPNPSNQSIYYQTMHNASDVIVTIRYTKTGGNS